MQTVKAEVSSLQKTDACIAENWVYNSYSPTCYTITQGGGIVDAHY